MGPDSVQRLRRSSHLGWITSLFWRRWGWSYLAVHNELLQVIGAVVAVCVHPLNLLHFVFGKFQVWLNDCGVRAWTDFYYRQETCVVPNLTGRGTALFWNSSRITHSVHSDSRGCVWAAELSTQNY